MNGKEWRQKKRTGSWEFEFASRVDIYSQEELDQVPADFKGSIYICFGTEEKRAVLDRKLSARIRVPGDNVVEIRKPHHVHVFGNSIVYAWNKYEGWIWPGDRARVYNLEED